MLQSARNIEKTGKTTTHRSNDYNIGVPTEGAEDWATFCLGNSDLALFAMSYNESGLGTIEGAYFCITPVFCAAGKLPHSYEAYSEAKRESEMLEKEGQWEQATELNSWLFSNSKGTDAIQSGAMANITYTRNHLLKLT